MLENDFDVSSAPSDDGPSNHGYFGRLRTEMFPFVPEGVEHVLDIGCATGLFGEQLQQLGARVTGVEINPQAARMAEAKLFQVYVGAIEDVVEVFSPESFDCIVMNDVLEHLADPWALVRQLNGLLTKNGCLIGSIPNVRHHSIIRQLLRDADWSYVDEGIMDRTHLRFFTSSTILKLFGGSGLVVEKIEGINETPVPWKLGLMARLMFSKPEEIKFVQFGFRARKALP